MRESGHPAFDRRLEARERRKGEDETEGMGKGRGKWRMTGKRGRKNKGRRKERDVSAPGGKDAGGQLVVRMIFYLQNYLHDHQEAQTHECTGPMLPLMWPL